LPPPLTGLSEGDRAEPLTIVNQSINRLFAERGIHGVSVRTILSEAGVNVALAHYHFGSRDGLIHEVVRRRVLPLNAERLRLLNELEQATSPKAPSLESVIRAFFAPVVELLEIRPEFARFLGRLYVTADEALREFFLSEFGEVLVHFSEALKKVLPFDIPDPQRHCRGLFMFGAGIYLLTNSADLKLMARGRYKALRADELLDELVTFCVAGLTAGRRVSS
jgi:AcrR family transcriptional regulator